MSQYNQKTYDNATLLKAAGLVGVSTAGSVILDLGNAMMEADMVIDVSALEIASGDELYTISLEGSNVASMATGSVELAAMRLGNNPAPADSDTAIGRHILPIRNELEDTLYRYVRVNTQVAGAVATGINYTAFLGKRNS